MKRYQYLLSGSIVVEGDAGLYVGTAAEFAIDAGRAVIGAPGLMYAPGDVAGTFRDPNLDIDIVPGRVHCVIDAAGRQSASGLGAAQLAAIDTVIANVGALVAAQTARVNAAMTLQERRRREYNKRGVTAEALAAAIVERVIEGRPEALDALQAIRLQVKAEIV